MDLSQELTYIKGVGPSRAELLDREIGIRCQRDLLFYFPYKYIDRSRIYKINELRAGMSFVQVVGTLQSFQLQGQGRGKRLTARLADDTGILELVWFKGIKYVVDRYKEGEKYLVFGKPTQFGHGLNLAHPDLEVASEGNLHQLTQGLQAYYSVTEKMKDSYLNSRAIQKIVVSLFQSMDEKLPETLPEYLREQLHLKSLDESVRQVHFPTDSIALQEARQRLKMEELLYLQLQILRYAQDRRRRLKGHPFPIIGDYFNRFYRECLPFTLTNAQKRVIREIRHNVEGEVQMNRLVQGDVGSGKTLVALMSMLMALDNGYQACLMAPTEILAKQHYDKISTMVAPLGIRVDLLTGSTRKAVRDELHAALESGQCQLLIGTHALIEDTVRFSRLGLVVIDEQHRFGVAQRSKLWTKNEVPPHVLVMTATPIPRTLAMTLYGDLDVSVIDELPAGRKPIQTFHRFDNQRAALYKFIHGELAAGRQIYVVYPLIEESEKSDYQNLMDGFQHISEVFSEVKVGMVHGRMKPAEKDEQMQAFARGETRVLVATTVIEVGVDVPNASVMVIQNAERFGLSQLHQLRGRVGRGADQSYCVLMTSPKLSDDSRKRVEIVTSSCDGFEIAEADLKLRGPGDLEGVQQSGMPFDLKIADLAHDGPLVEYARNVARRILDEDPDLEQARHLLLRRELQKRYGRKINWGVIS